MSNRVPPRYATADGRSLLGDSVSEVYFLSLIGEPAKFQMRIHSQIDLFPELRECARRWNLL